MKKIFSILTFIICCFFLTGCVDLKISEELTVNPDSSVDHSIQMLASDNVIFMQERINQEFKEALQSNGFGNFSRAKEMNYFGIKGSSHMEGNGYGGQIDSIPLSNKYFHMTDNSRDYFFFKYYDITVNVDINGMFDSVDNEMVTLSEYKFILNLPVKIQNANANNVYNNNQSATWLFTRDGQNSIHVEFYIINYENIIIVGSVLILLIILLIILIIINNVKKRNRKRIINKPVQAAYCPECGARLGPEDVFCGECGTEVNRGRGK